MIKSEPNIKKINLYNPSLLYKNSLNDKVNYYANKSGSLKHNYLYLFIHF